MRSERIDLSKLYKSDAAIDVIISLDDSQTKIQIKAILLAFPTRLRTIHSLQIIVEHRLHLMPTRERHTPVRWLVEQNKR